MAVFFSKNLSMVLKKIRQFDTTYLKYKDALWQTVVALFTSQHVLKFSTVNLSDNLWTYLLL